MSSELVVDGVRSFEGEHVFCTLAGLVEVTSAYERFDLGTETLDDQKSKAFADRERSRDKNALLLSR